MKTKLPDYVVAEINECLKKNEKRTTAYWRKFIGVGPKAIELIKQYDVIAEDKLEELKDVQMARHILLANGYTTMEGILKGFLEGKIYIKAFRNYGADSHRYICELLIRWLNSKL